MTNDLPAMRRFKEMFRTQADGRDAAGPHLAAQLVADVEAEGSALIGAVKCHSPVHGREHDDGTITPLLGPCLTCGAAL